MTVKTRAALFKIAAARLTMRKKQNPRGVSRGDVNEPMRRAYFGATTTICVNGWT